MNGFEICKTARQVLTEAGCFNVNELNSLFLAATGINRLEAAQMQLTESQAQTFLSLVNRRTQGEPLQYLCGEWPFMDFTVHVDERALIPRPETELLAERCIACFQGPVPGRILDLCSGSGVIAIAAKKAFPSASVTAVELSEEACSLIKENSSLNKTEIEIVCSDAKEYLESVPNEFFDLIICNPPYVTPEDYRENYAELMHEPEMAFIGGDDGLYFYNLLTEDIYRCLKKGGWLGYEIGNEQGDSVKDLVTSAGFTDISLAKDWDNLDRDIICRRP